MHTIQTYLSTFLPIRGIVNTPENLPKSEGGGFDQYFYTEPPAVDDNLFFSLLLRYLKARNFIPRNQRVFIPFSTNESTYFGLVMELTHLSDPNPALWLKQEMLNGKFPTIKHALNDKDVKAGLKAMYKNLSGKFVGVSSQEVEPYIQHFKKYLPGPPGIGVNLSRNPELFFTAAVLKQFVSNSININETVIIFQGIALDGLTPKVNELKKRDPESYERLRIKLRDYTKQGLTNKYQLTFKLEKMDIQALEDTEYKTKLNKERIDREPEKEIEDYAKKMILPLLISLNSLKYDELLEYIEKLHKAETALYHKWQAELAERLKEHRSWRKLTPRLLKQVFINICYSTAIAMGSQIVGIVDKFKEKNNVSYGISKALAYCGVKTLQLVRAKSLANKLEHYVKENKEETPLLSNWQWYGAVTGLVYTIYYFDEPTSLAEWMLTYGIARSVGDLYLHVPKWHTSIHADISNVTRGTYVAVRGVESLRRWDFNHFAGTLGGFGGSFALPYITKKIEEGYEWYSEKEIPKEVKSSVAYLSTLLGLMAGQRLTTSYIKSEALRIAEERCNIAKENLSKTLLLNGEQKQFIKSLECPSKNWSPEFLSGYAVWFGNATHSQGQELEVVHAWRSEHFLPMEPPVLINEQAIPNHHPGHTVNR